MGLCDCLANHSVLVYNINVSVSSSIFSYLHIIYQRGGQQEDSQTAQ